MVSCWAKFGLANPMKKRARVRYRRDAKDGDISVLLGLRNRSHRFTEQWGCEKEIDDERFCSAVLEQDQDKPQTDNDK